jgi:hypothetical protein
MPLTYLVKLEEEERASNDKRLATLQSIDTSKDVDGICAED